MERPKKLWMADVQRAKSKKLELSVKPDGGVFEAIYECLVFFFFGSNCELGVWRIRLSKGRKFVAKLVIRIGTDKTVRTYGAKKQDRVKNSTEFRILLYSFLSSGTYITL